MELDSIVHGAELSTHFHISLDLTFVVYPGAQLYCTSSGFVIVPVCDIREACASSHVKINFSRYKVIYRSES